MRYARKITKIVTAHTYTQLRLTKIKFLITLRRFSASEGNRMDTKEIMEIKIILGKVTPRFNVVLNMSFFFTFQY